MDAFTEEELAALKELAQDYQDNSVSRRAALGIMGAGALTGAAGASALTGSAAAQPTGDEGQVGTQSNRVEAWVSEADAQEITTDDGAIGGDPILGGPATSSSGGVSLDTWTTLDANQPVLYAYEIEVQTDGTTRGLVQFGIDEDGGTNDDYRWNHIADADLPAGVSMRYTNVAYVPAGAQVIFDNQDDPNNANTIQMQRIYVVSS